MENISRSESRSFAQRFAGPCTHIHRSGSVAGFAPDDTRLTVAVLLSMNSMSSGLAADLREI